MNSTVSKLETIKEKIVALKEKSPILMGVILLICSFLTTRGLHLIYNLAGVLNGGSHIELMIRELIYVGVVMLALWATDQKHIFGCKGKGFFSSLWSGTSVLLIIAATIIVDHFVAVSEGMERRSVFEIVVFAVFLLAIGFAEEVLYRGIICESINRRYGNTGIGAVLALLSSSVIFGLAHFSNIFAGQTVDDTVNQVISTMFVGFIFGVIYLKRRNIFAVALIHALYDLAAMYLSGIYNIGSILDSSAPAEEIVTIKDIVLSNSIYLIVGIILFIPYLIRLGKNRKEQRLMAAA